VKYKQIGGGILVGVKCYMLDIDGTVSLGNNLISGADKFIEEVRNQGKRVIFMTNNSSKNREAYQVKLRNLGIETSIDEILTSGNATVYYLNSIKPKAKVYLLGNEYLRKDFTDAGFQLVDKKNEEVDFVVLGFDTTLTYDKIWAACDYIRKGVTYVATHPDMNCPLENDMWMPDTGAMIEMIYASTGERPVVIGKPNKLIVDVIKKQFGYQNSDLAMVGDRLYTDMMLGVNANIKKILVLSGETNLKTYNSQSIVKADKVFNSIKDLYDQVK